jgi:hypothetical protein
MNETEATELERLLRNSVAGHRPAAPDALLEFIETVPTRERQSGPIGRILGGRMARRGVLGLAAAAAVVVALVGSAALMSSRRPSVPASEPANVSDGWQWQATDGTVYPAAFPVANGYIAACGRLSGQALEDQVLCSSPDALHWSVPADPAIVSVEGGGPLLPITLYPARDGTYLGMFSRGSGEGTGPGWTLWRSSDGVHWAAVDAAKALGLTWVDLAAVVPGGFLARGTKNEPGPLAEEMLISADGLTWSVAGDMPYGSPAIGAGYSFGGGLGALYAAGPRSGGTEIGTWMTTDGRNWQDVSLPAGYTQVLGTVALPSGGFLGLGSSFDAATPNRIISSTDGLAWELDPSGPAGSVDQLYVVRDRLVAAVSATPYDGPLKVLQSLDWGKSWRPLLDLSGKPVSGTISYLGGGHLGIMGADLIVHWVLTPVKPDPAASPIEGTTAPVSAFPSESETPSVTPEPSATAVESAAPTPEPSATPVESAAPTPEPSATAVESAPPTPEPTPTP